MGGATALLFYTEPALTFDIDIFVFLPDAPKTTGLIQLTPIYETLQAQGYQTEQEHIIIEGIPVQLIPAYNDLISEAILEAPLKPYEDIKVKVFTLEHLLAIMIDTNRPKDRARISDVLEQTEVDKNKLNLILQRYSLEKKWEKFVETR
jgi:hypothetical protein